MSFNPTTSVDDIVMLVIDKNNKRFGQLGRLSWHDWNEYGVYRVSFAHEAEDFPDGLCKGDPPSPVKAFYRGYLSNPEKLEIAYQRLFEQELP